MIPSYNFNEQLKRFEPIEKKCTYCIDKNENTDVQSAYYVPLFKEQDRTNVVVYRSVKYQKIQIGVPRCESCRKVHESQKSTAILCAIGVSAVILTLGIALFGIVGGFVGFLIAIFAGFFSAGYFEDQFVTGKGILTQRGGAETNDIVQTFVLSGWSFNQPTA